jgi:hypothetical protein
MHISEEVFGEDGNIDPQKLDLVARMGQNWYCRANGAAVFEVPKPGFVVGMGFDALPKHIRNSSILTGNDLGRLAMASDIPAKNEIAEYCQQPNVKQLLKDYHHKQKQVERMLHKNAHRLLEEGKTTEAWKMLLSPNCL